eukprot:SAG22_NODE_1844_length_3454_cov_2.054844_1_plen_103_part_00
MSECSPWRTAVDSSPTGEAELGALKGLISGQLEEATAELVSRVQLLLQQDRVEAAAEGERRLQQLDETLERRLPGRGQTESGSAYFRRCRTFCPVIIIDTRL